MANTVQIQTLHDGTKLAVIKAYLASDGSSGELADQVIVDASALSGAPTNTCIEGLWVSTVGCSVSLEWDATTDVPILAIPTDTTEAVCFEKIGGLPNNAGAGKTGDILLSTAGFTAAGDSVTLILRVRKD